uniref:Uncharacterized protein n=1 Tax=Apteryx owenii TaxID=8824 RepID=A0A8B9PVW8_APTOW
PCWCHVCKKHCSITVVKEWSCNEGNSPAFLSTSSSAQNSWLAFGKSLRLTFWDFLILLKLPILCVSGIQPLILPLLPKTISVLV